MIIVNLDVMLAKRKMKSNELADKIGITTANLSILKTGKAKAIRFTTLEAICKNSTASQEISWNTGQMNRNYIRRLSLGEDGR